MWQTTRKFLRIMTVRRKVFAWAKALSSYLEMCGKTHRLVMIRLSFQYGEDWRPLAISEYLQKMKKILRKKLLAYAWVAELQQRGVIHYHVVLLVSRGANIPKPDESGMWNFGSSRIETARTPFYLCEYVKKKYQKMGEFPKGARICSAYIQKGILDEKALAKYHADCAPKWVREKRAFLIEVGWLDETDKIVKREGKWFIGDVEAGSGPYRCILSTDAESESEQRERERRSRRAHEIWTWGYEAYSNKKESGVVSG